MGTAPISRGVIVALAGAAVAFATFGSAATLGGLESSALGAGDGPITRCDTAFGILPATSAGNVVTVTVNDVADACEGGDLTVTLTNGGGSVVASVGPTPIPVDGDALPSTVAVGVTPNPLAEQVVNGHVSVVGP
jgi:hypothetical protein